MQELFNPSNTTCRCRKLRKCMPPAEVILWQTLRGRQLCGLKFRRQFGIESYVLDFYCAELRLAIELDGESHESDRAQQHDLRRDNYVRALGVTTLCFGNADVYSNLDGVLTEIVAVVKKLAER